MNLLPAILLFGMFPSAQSRTQTDHDGRPLRGVRGNVGDLGNAFAFRSE